MSRVSPLPHRLCGNNGNQHAVEHQPNINRRIKRKSSENQSKISRKSSEKSHHATVLSRPLISQSPIPRPPYALINPAFRKQSVRNLLGNHIVMGGVRVGLRYLESQKTYGHVFNKSHHSWQFSIISAFLLQFAYVRGWPALAPVSSNPESHHFEYQNPSF